MTEPDDAGTAVPEPADAPDATADAAMLPNAAPEAPTDGTPELDPADASLLALVDRLGVLLERSDLSELAVEAGGTRLVLRKPSALPSPVAVAAPASEAAPPAGAEANGPASPGGAASTARPSVLAPLTGIWYGSPAPGSAAFVAAGREVAVGQVIGLIEAMKLFNEIKSDLAGRVVRVIPENGALVKAKQPLIEVEPL
ncbi:MAG TPA: biotin/lipoyl-containing protein [Candidatus Limnocylindrales bacterium]|nr:biotin/lipoyl-containing protein [Candidatus Limnocylindrales bacterium]